MTTIHVIDRDAAVRLAARRALEPAGFAVSEATDADCALPARPALVIADLAVASLAAIRRRHPATRILGLTGDGFSRGDARLLAGRIGKPFTPSQLLAAVRLCLARPGFTQPCATTGSRRRSARPPPRRA
jgi:DNA-binding response OmpR family regulator